MQQVLDVHEGLAGKARLTDQPQLLARDAAAEALIEAAKEKGEEEDPEEAMLALELAVGRAAVKAQAASQLAAVEERILASEEKRLARISPVGPSHSAIIMWRSNVMYECDEKTELLAHLAQRRAALNEQRAALEAEESLHF